MHDTSAPTHGASEWSAIPPAMVQPPPRPVPRGGVSAIARTVSPAAAIGAAALSMFSLFYGPVFLAMGAPRALAVAFAVPGVLGALLGAGWVITVWRGVSLLRRGESTLGEVVSVSEEGATFSSTLVRVSYTFRPAPGADSVRGTTVVPGRPGLLEARAGDAMAVCFDPHRPKRSIALAALN